MTEPSEHKTFYSSGQLREHEHIQNGKLHGERKEWYENGQLWVQEYYQDGILDGEFKIWYENGQLFKLGSYHKARREGRYSTFLNRLNLHSSEDNIESEFNKKKSFYTI